MSKHEEHSGWQTFALAIMAGIATQNVALVADGWVTAAVCPMDGGAGHAEVCGRHALMALLAMAVATLVSPIVHRRMALEVTKNGHQLSGHYYDPVLVTQTPGLIYKVGLPTLGLLALLFVVGLHMLAHDGWTLLTKQAHLPDWTVLVTGAVVALAIAHRLAATQVPRLNYEKGEIGPYTGVAIFLSHPLSSRLAHAVDRYPPGNQTWESYQRDFLEMEFPHGFGVAEIDRAFGRNNWAMPVRLISKLVLETGSLREVVVIGSRGDVEKATAPMVPFFIERMKVWFGDGVTYHALNVTGIDSENLEEVQDAAEEALAILGKEKESRVCIDVTGGQKPWTIGAMVATLRKGTSFTYVSTTNKENIAAYDASIEVPTEPGSHHP